MAMIALLAKNANNVFAMGPGKDRKTPRAEVSSSDLSSSFIFGYSPTSSPNYASLGLVKVSGTLKLDGAPLSNVEVRFENPETSIYSYGTTNDSGRFSLMFDSRTAGIIPGRKLLRVLPKQKSESSTTDSKGASEGEQDALAQTQRPGGLIQVAQPLALVGSPVIQPVSRTGASRGRLL